MHSMHRTPLLLVFAAAANAVTHCDLKPSGPIAATDNQVIEFLSITTNTTTPGITVTGKKNVVIRNVRVTHHKQSVYPFGVGISFSGAVNLSIVNVSVVLEGVESGPLPDLHNYNIFGRSSPAVHLDNIFTTGGSTGIELDHCYHAVVERVVGKNLRGPYPRGQCVQLTYCDNAIVQDFYCQNDNTSWVEDNLSIYRSSNVTVRRGLVDGNNSPSGVGVMFEQDDASKHGGLLEDVDAIRMGDGCFSMYGGTDITFNRLRCKDNHCDGWSGRPVPMSHSMMWYAGDESGVNTTGGRVKNSVYSNACNPSNIIASTHPGAWVEQDIKEADFDLRLPVELSFCWN